MAQSLRTKCKIFGVRSLSDTEILRLALRVKDNDEPLLKAIAILKKLTFNEEIHTEQLMEALKITESLAVQIIALCEFARRYRIPKSSPPLILSSNDAFSILAQQQICSEQESFWVLGLSHLKELRLLREVARGGLTRVQVHPREVFRPAIKNGCTGIILAHNHPSDNINASHEDMVLTERLVNIGKLVGIPVVDHLILGSEQYFSFADKGILDMP